MTAPTIQPVQANPAPAAPEAVPSWKIVLQVIAEVAVQVLVPFAITFLLFLTIPTSISAIVIPIGAVSSVFAVSFMFAGQSPFEVARVAAPLPATAPHGIQNAGCNCWLNSLVQVIRCDKKMSEWFEGVPHNIPAAQPPFAPLSLANHLAEIPFVQQPQAVTEDQLNAMNGIIAQVPNSERYVHFLAKISPAADAENPISDRQKIWNALAAFKEFMDAYKLAERENLPQIPYNSQNLRLCLHALKPPMYPGDPNGISTSAGQQLDPTEGLNPIIDQLLPKDFKIEVETRRYFHLDGNPPMAAGDNVIAQGEAIKNREVVNFLPVPILGNHPDRAPDLGTLWNRTLNNTEIGADPYRAVGTDGVQRPYRPKETQTHFVHAPSSLWVPLSRFKYVKSGAWECLTRLLPKWFPGVPLGTQKIKTPVDIQDTLELQPIEGDLARYKLDSFILHLGDTGNSGHYISYKLGKDAEDNDVWYEMNDSSVRALSDREAKELRNKAYVFHFSKEEE